MGVARVLGGAALASVNCLAALGAEDRQDLPQRVDPVVDRRAVVRAEGDLRSTARDAPSTSCPYRSPTISDRSGSTSPVASAASNIAGSGLVRPTDSEAVTESKCSNTPSWSRMNRPSSAFTSLRTPWWGSVSAIRASVGSTWDVGSIAAASVSRNSGHHASSDTRSPTTAATARAYPSLAARNSVPSGRGSSRRASSATSPRRFRGPRPRRGPPLASRRSRRLSVGSMPRRG